MFSTLRFLFFIFPFFCYSQGSNTAFKWGIIPEEQLLLASYPKDSTAKALILQDKGKTNFFFGSAHGAEVRFSRHRRIKVFDKSALKEGNLLLTYYSYKDYERFTYLDVMVHNPDGSALTLDSRTFKTKKLSKYYSAKQIFVPNIVEGSIIELRYELSSSDYYYLQDWDIQDEYPIVHSEFTSEIPAHLEYVTLYRYPSPVVLDTFYKKRAAIGGGYSDINCHKVILRDVPALKEEPFCHTINDYKGIIRFQLSRIINGNNKSTVIRRTWEDLADELYTKEWFGRHLNNERGFSSLWEKCQPLLHDTMSISEKTAVIHDFVSSSITWNGEHSIYPNTKSLNDVYKIGAANSAALSLAMTALLRKADIDAWPVLVSTLSHGAYFHNYPMLRQFNSVMVWINELGAGLIADPTHNALGINLVRTEMYNKQGWVVNPKAPFWRDFKTPTSVEAFVTNLKLNEDGKAVGDFNYKATNQLGFKQYLSLKEVPDQESINPLLWEGIKAKNIKNVSVSESFKEKQATKIQAELEIDGIVEFFDDMLIVQPVFTSQLADSPFSALNRQFKINFEYPHIYKIISTLKIPKGYKIDSKPDNINMVLPDNAGKFTYTLSTPDASSIRIIARFSITALDIHPEAYGIIREFFESASNKLNEQIVLIKTD